MQTSPNREKMSITAWIHSCGVKRFCCDWCIKDKLDGRLQSKNYCKPKNSKKRTLRMHRTRAQNFWALFKKEIV